MKRSAGILLPITSLPSPYGIGTMGKSAKDFVDFLVEAKQTYWQILPIGPTGYGDSPYASFSSYAGHGSSSVPGSPLFANRTHWSCTCRLSAGSAGFPV